MFHDVDLPSTRRLCFRSRFVRFCVWAGKVVKAGEGLGEGSTPALVSWIHTPTPSRGVNSAGSLRIPDLGIRHLCLEIRHLSWEIRSQRLSIFFRCCSPERSCPKESRQVDPIRYQCLENAFCTYCRSVYSFATAVLLLIWICFIYCLFSCIRFVVFVYRLVNKVDHLNFVAQCHCWSSLIVTVISMHFKIFHFNMWLGVVLR